MKQKIVELEDRIDYIILNQKYEMNEGEQNDGISVVRYFDKE